MTVPPSFVVMSAHADAAVGGLRERAAVMRKLEEQALRAVMRGPAGRRKPWFGPSVAGSAEPANSAGAQHS
jgi:hypothetical protein